MLKKFYTFLSVFITLLALLAFIGLSTDVFFDKDFSLLPVYLTLPLLIFLIILHSFNRKIFPKLKSLSKTYLPIIIIILIIEIVVAALRWPYFSDSSLSQILFWFYLGILSIFLLLTLLLNNSKKS